MHAVMIGDFWLEYNPHPVEDSGHGCLDCGAHIGYRAKRCHTHANQESARRRTARRKAKKMVQRCLDIHHERQKAKAVVDAAIDAALGTFGREVERAERSVRG